LQAAGEFYDAVLAILDMQRLKSNEFEIGYENNFAAKNANNNDASFWIISPYNKQPATHGNGSQVTFKANSQEQVKAFYHAVLEQGGSDDGAPGPRNYAANYYGAYCRDLDGNKLHVFYLPES